MLHATSFSGIWPLPDTVTWVTSWPTLRRDRPNRSAMARWLSGAPAATGRRADRLLHIARHLRHGWHAGGRVWPARAAHELDGDLDRADERDCGPGQDQCAEQPVSRSVGEVRADRGADAEPQHQPGQPWRVAVVAGLVQQREEAPGSARPRSAGAAGPPCHPARGPGPTRRCGVRDHRREGGHGADHGRRREADHPVPAHRLAPPRATAAGPLDAGRGLISELSLKQQG